MGKGHGAGGAYVLSAQKQRVQPQWGPQAWEGRREAGAWAGSAQAAGLRPCLYTDTSASVADVSPLGATVPLNPWVVH